jgi:hypothetical protein
MMVNLEKKGPKKGNEDQQEKEVVLANKVVLDHMEKRLATGDRVLPRL